MITIHAKKANNWKEKTCGLIGKSKAYPFFFQTRFGIHTFGLKFSIDVVILNIENKVIALKENLQPNNIFLWNPKYNNVLELPAGVIKKEKIKVGDYLKINV